ncbi:MAG TPA: DNA translocase FtsK [Xanthobacteraceae bacterium]|nr:DNA translocase FtsK [Xanthobacteraceae bacterium]
MTAIDRTLDNLHFLTDDMRDAVRRRLRELGGLGLLGIGVMLALALATWSVQDPSYSHATSGEAHNMMGRIGATVADLMMQLLGLGSLVFVLPVAIWGWRLVTHRPLHRERLRVLAWFTALVLAAAFFACLPASPRWPLPTGLGGVVGDAVLRLPLWLSGGAWSGLTTLAVAIGTGAGAVAAFAVASGLGWRLREIADDYAAPLEGEDDDESSSVSLGWLTHAFLTTRARVARLLRQRRERRDIGRDSRGIQRREPGFASGGGRPHAEPRFDDAPRLAPDMDDHGRGDDDFAPTEDFEDEPAPVARRAKPMPKPTKPARTGKGFQLPSLDLLAAPKRSDRATVSADTLQQNSEALEGVLGDFGVRGEIINARPGPVVTLYELEPAPGIKSSRVIGLADDIARSMSALSARVAVVSGRNAIGIELPNATREKVYFRELLATKDYDDTTAKLPLCLGKTIGGEPVIVDLARMPHLLIAGTTGSGKSVAINTMILSLLYKHRPEQCRLIMVDPKMLELSVYDGIPHLLTPVVTDPKKAVVALKWAVREMEDRYKKMAKLGVRNIDGYNTRVAEAAGKGEQLTRTVHTGYDKESGEAIYEEERLDLEKLPYIVVIVDEMADLMMVAGKDIEGAIQRLAQMARAAGIHVVLATQRPSVDVITGTIKANFPTRISFQVTSKIDSRTILGEQGAEQLLGQGDMLHMAGGGRISRVHGPFCSDEEVEKIVRHLKSQGAPQYLEAVTADDGEGEDGSVFDATGMGQSGDATDLYQQAVQIVLRDQKASTSYIQRRLQIGYNRAASLMERMELEGVVGQANHAGKREILIEAGGEERF